jgi:hypothetical protein
MGTQQDIKPMEDRGLVERGECSEDGRGAFVVIAPSGPCWHVDRHRRGWPSMTKDI